MTVKNGEKTIHNSVESIFFQTIAPSLVCVVDDGSTDSTPIILQKLKDVHERLQVITLPDRGYDIRRIVHNWNTGCEYLEETKRKFDYLLISSDDIIFPKDYVAQLIGKMEENQKLAITSGSRGLAQSDYMSLPEGAGRLIRCTFFKEIGYRHPPYYGYEPWILYRALQLGYEIQKFSDIKYDHARTFGVGHHFIEYGPAMRCLGYHPLFALARIARNIVSAKSTGISRTASIRMIGDYLFANKWKNDPYFHYFDPDFRSFVRSTQKKRLLAMLH